MPLELKVIEKKEDIVILDCAGDIRKTCDIEDIKRKLDSLLNAGERGIVMNLGGIRHITTEAIGFLLRKKFEMIEFGGDMIFYGAPSFLTERLRVLGIEEKIIGIYTDYEMALKSLRDSILKRTMPAYS